MLERVEPEVGELGDLLVRRPDTENPTRILGSAIVGVYVVVQQAVTLCHCLIVTGGTRSPVPGSSSVRAQVETVRIYPVPAMESPKLARTMSIGAWSAFAGAQQSRVVDLIVSNLFNLCVVIGAVVMFAATDSPVFWLGAALAWQR